MTAILVAALGDDYTGDCSHTWWYNKRGTGGFRLTDTGLQVLRDKLALEFYEFPIKTTDLDSKTLITLDKHLDSPYYVCYNRRRQPEKILFFGSMDATVAYLYDDLRLFAQNALGGVRNDRM